MAPGTWQLGRWEECSSDCGTGLEARGQSGCFGAGGFERCLGAISQPKGALSVKAAQKLEELFENDDRWMEGRERHVRLSNCGDGTHTDVGRVPWQVSYVDLETSTRLYAN